MSNILDQIVENRKREVFLLKKALPVSELINRIDSNYNVNSLCKALIMEGSSGIIAEFKRCSPSKGIINDKAEPSIVTKGYSEAGASGISVLTEVKHFGGCNGDLEEIRNANSAIPILRKDFIVDEYQIYESRMLKADVVLLIAAVLDKKEISDFISIAHELCMEVLLELHEENEIKKIDGRADMIGINNRNLRDFSVNIERSLRLMEKLPREAIKISESGISDPEIVNQLRKRGFKGFLMGENFMKTNNPGEACREFILKLTN